MAIVGEPEHHTIFRHPEHCVNQVAVRTLANGELVCVFNEERFPYHHDSGQTLLVRSRDGGVTWSEPTVVLPWSETLGNWDSGICELADGTLLVNLSITGFFKRGIKPEQPLVEHAPHDPGMGGTGRGPGRPQGWPRNGGPSSRWTAARPGAPP